tara:strand:+ start:17479 stop:19242 length:1764 start_codon:yes stop_codon:yes gene_type:complete
MPAEKGSMPEGAMELVGKGNANFAKKKAIRVANEIAQRRLESLNLYVPQATQDEFHQCDAPECMIMGGNRGGKSLAAFVEIARAVQGKDPYKKYPLRDGVCAIIGYKQWHIGNVIYGYLFKAGAFKIIRDSETNLWRVYRPWVPQDKARAKEAKPAPPLIPPRMIEKIVWQDRAKQIFSNVFLKNGWEIKAFSSRSKPEQGWQGDLISIDEDILDPSWYEESAGRLIDRAGRLIWSALPHDENDAMARFAERAETQEEAHERGGPKPTTVVYRISMESNPYLPEEAKKAAVAGWKSMGDDVYRKRALGEMVTDSVLMYPMWKRGLHDIQGYAGQLNGEADQYLKERRVPQHWCRRLAVDPGHDTAAAVLVATPPSGKWHLVYDEIYIHQCDARKIAYALSKKTAGVWFQTFVIDAHGGNLTSIDTGIAPREAYEREMKKEDVQCVETRHRFIPGCSVIAYREEVYRGMLSVGGSGSPQLIVDFERCPNLDREMRRFRKKKVNGNVTDTGNRRSNTHAVECLEYLAAYLTDSRQTYIPPKNRRRVETPGQRRVRQFKERKRLRQEAANPFGAGTSTIILGPTGIYEDG